MSPAPVRLLIVDDNEMIRQGVRELLARHEEYVVCGEAADGLEATEMALQLQPDIVLMDVSMPLMDGVEATRIIRRDLPQTDVIIVTQNDPVLVRQQVARIGAKALVSKDAIGRELIPTILSVVSDRKLDRSGTSTRYSVPPGVAEARKKIEGHEERRRSTRIAAEIGMWEWDPAKINQVLSPELFRIFGIDPEDPNHAATWASRVHPDDSERVQRLMESGYKSGALDFEYRYNHPELGLRWLYCKGARISGASRMFGLVQDVTEWRKAETALGESEQRFREMIDALPAAVYTTDAQGRLTHFNQAAVKLSGRVPNLGSDQWCVTWKLFRPDGSPLPHDQCPMAVALKEGRCVDGMEAIAERPDGKRVWFVPYPRVFRDADGRIVGGINMLVDITERKSAEQASGHLAAIVDSSDDAIVSKNLDGIITSWNRGAERIFGYTAEEIIGKPITTIIPLNRRDEETDILSRIRRGERVDHFETVRQRKDGSFIDVSVTISPMRDASGRIVGASKVARDVTDRRRAEERERAIAQAAVAATAKFRAIFEQTTVFAGIMTRDGILIEANKLSLEACGYRSEQVLGRPFWETPWWRDFWPVAEKDRGGDPGCCGGGP